MGFRGLVLLTALLNCVLSLPVTPSQLEIEDVKVMRCIVEVLADVLSGPHFVPVSQECLITLKADDRLVTILRHRNFLKELQEIAVEGGQERAHLERDASLPTLFTQTPHTADHVADRSMLEPLGSSGERSISSPKKVTDNEDGIYEKMEDTVEDGETREENGFEGVPVKREHHENSKRHIHESVNEKREDEEEDGGSEEERAKALENAEEENGNGNKRGVGSDDKAPRSRAKEKKSNREHEQEKDRMSTFLSRKQEHRHEEAKREREESLTLWAKRSKSLPLSKKTVGLQLHKVSNQQEVPHHSKEVMEETDGEKRDSQRSPEEQELQMIAHGTPEERKGSEEEGSASRKSEDAEIESLAAIESELENVAQKLHGLRHG